MYTIDIPDPYFRDAVAAVDSGNIPALKQLLEANPRLVHDHLDTPAEGYFKHPYLLWFVAGNPIRHPTLPANITGITKVILDVMKHEQVKNYGQQLDYTLVLVATGSVARDCGVQVALIDVLLDAGASLPETVHGAIAHNNLEAAEHLLKKGCTLTLTAAICLNHKEDIERLARDATPDELQVALVAAAFFGKAAMLSYLLQKGVDPNNFPENGSGFHSHATALHQAVYSGNQDAVKVLANAGARFDLTDKVYGGTPVDWADHMQTEEGYDEKAKKNFAEIARWLRANENNN